MLSTFFFRARLLVKVRSLSLSPHSPVLESTTTVGQVGMKCKGGIYSTATRALIRRLYTSIFWPLSAEVLAALQC